MFDGSNGKRMLRNLFILSLIEACWSASLRQSVYNAVVLRSGATSNCTGFAAMFDPAIGYYESPVGSGRAVGTAAIVAACNSWNAMLGPQGNGWYPGPCNHQLTHVAPQL